MSIPIKFYVTLITMVHFILLDLKHANISFHKSLPNGMEDYRHFMVIFTAREIFIFRRTEYIK